MGPAFLLLLSALAPAPAAAPPSLNDADIREAQCRFMVTDESGKPATIAAPDLHVLRQAAADGPFRPTLPPRASAIFCVRSTIVPAEHDDEVLALGIPFFIAEAGKDGRLAALELSGGRFRYRFLEGALKPGEVPLLQQRLDLFQKRK